jgi:hypothetical protein
MASKKRVAEDNLGAFLSPTDMGGGGFVVPMKSLNVGPGKPGPGDAWHVPSGPLDLEEDVPLERVPAAPVHVHAGQDEPDR